MSDRYDSHVRERRRLARRVLARRYDWYARDPVLKLPEDERICWAERQVDRFCKARRWIPGWDMRQTGRYHPIGGYDGPRVPYKDVPTHIIHSMMCQDWDAPVDAEEVGS